MINEINETNSSIFVTYSLLFFFTINEKCLILQALGEDGRNRTSDPLLKRQLLYP